ncbi:MAG: hypothetical protein DRH24_15455 [Deltaproteobacteria bacterium]|nr:MAG: hypothetical protein DRH24_15455 [Deltaproteobacteria bacterium]
MAIVHYGFTLKCLAYESLRLVRNSVIYFILLLLRGLHVKNKIHLFWFRLIRVRGKMILILLRFERFI